MPSFPWAIEYIWNWFGEFSYGLKSNGMGPTMASWGDVRDWCEAMMLDLEPWEKRTLVRLAQLRASVQSESEEEKAKAKAKKT